MNKHDLIKSLIEMHLADFPNGIPMYDEGICKYAYENVIVPMAKKAFLCFAISEVSDGAYSSRKRFEAYTWFESLYYASYYFRKGTIVEYHDSLRIRAFHLWHNLELSLNVNEVYDKFDVTQVLEEIEEAI